MKSSPSPKSRTTESSPHRTLSLDGKLFVRSLMREFPSHSEILEVFQQAPEKLFRLHDLVAALGIRSSQARDLKRALKDLTRQRKIVDLKKNHFGLIRAPKSLPSPEHATV